MKILLTEVEMANTERPQWLLAQIETHVQSLKSWNRMYGSGIFTDEQRQALAALSRADNPGDPRITHPVIFGEDHGPEEVEEVPGCKT